MASFDKLKLQGIRGVGPEEKSVQVVEFDKPLTLIAGQNGSGKTTLIEALKYITTGEMPPGKLAAFIHDPKMSGKVRTDGLVKLEFRDYKGRRCIATRRCTAILKNKTMKCASEEATIKIYNETTAQWTSVSSKQVDFAKEMSNLLNVPKAILDYVVFCHQDESNWPLSGTNKDLKTKFDAIFQADRYVKAVEHLNKLRKEYANDIKTIQIHLDHAKELLVDKREMMEKLARDKRALRENEVESERLKQKLAPLDAKLNAIIEEMRAVSEKTKSLDALRVRQSEILKTMRAMDVTPYNGALQDLLFEMSELDNSGRNTIEEQNRLRDEMDQLTKLVKIKQLERQTLTKQQGNFESSVQDREKKLGQRRQMIADYARKYQLNDPYCFGDRIGNESANEFWNDFEKKRRAGNERYHTTVQEYEKRLSDLRQKGQVIEIEMEKLKTSVEAKKETADRYARAARDARDKLQSIKRSQSRMSQVLSDISEVEEELGDCEGSSQVEGSIEELREHGTQLNAKLDILLGERKVVEELQGLMSNISYKRSDWDRKKAEFERTLTPHKDTLVEFLGAVPPAFVKDAVCDKLSEVTRERKLLEEDKARKDRSVADLSRNLETLESKLHESETKSSSVGREIRSVLKGDDVDRLIEEAEGELARLRLDKSVADGGKHVYEKFIEQAEKNQCCPLCDRSYDRDRDLDTLVNKMKRKVKVLPKDSIECGRQIDEKEASRTKLLAVKQTVEQCHQLDNDEIPNLKAQIETLTRDCKNAQLELNKVIGELKEAERREERLRSVESESSLIDSTRRNLADLEREISSLESRLPKTGTGRSLEQIDSEFDTAKKDLNEVGEKLKRREDYMKEINKLNRKLNDLTAEKNSLSGSEHQIEALKISEAENDNLAAKYRKEYEQDQLAFPQMKANIKDIAVEMERTKGELTNRKAVMDNELSEMSTDSARLKAVNDGLEESIDYRSSLDEILTKLTQIDKDVSESTERRILVERRLQDVNAEVSNREGRRLKLASQKQLIEMEETRKQLNMQIAEKEAAVGGLTLNQIENQRVALVEETNELRRQIHTLDGELNNLRPRVEETEAQLARNKFKNAEKDVYDYKVDKITLEEATKDLLKYGTALDRAIVEYHSSKMEEINDRLDEYWRKVYSGGDIDTVRIKSEGISATEKKRTYDYKVVMVIDYKEYDMRDRCSAGQKVLASILIRLALADVFCNSCGMIALDEPTTNLDIVKVHNTPNRHLLISHSRLLIP